MKLPSSGRGLRTDGVPLRPRRLRLEASTACQLRCPSCPTTEGRIGEALGTGFLAFAHFKRLIDENPWVRDVELSNWGEIFLNPDLLTILEYAYRKNVAIRADNGVNFNTVKDDVLEGLVKYRVRSMTCSIDGASNQTYGLYRRRGCFDQVIENVRKLNALKARYRSDYPELHWQFIAFGSNEHEIPRARAQARALRMTFDVKLSWGDMYTAEAFSPVNNKDLVRRETAGGVADRREYRQKYGRNYLQKSICAELWRSPQINWDGKVLGCAVNHWGDFGNAFQDGLVQSLNNEKITYARRMLLGRVPPRADIPCTTCTHYQAMQADGRWLTRRDTASAGTLPQVMAWAWRKSVSQVKRLLGMH